MISFIAPGAFLVPRLDSAKEEAGRNNGGRRVIESFHHAWGGFSGQIQRREKKNESEATQRRERRRVRGGADAPPQLKLTMHACIFFLSVFSARTHGKYKMENELLTQKTSTFQTGVM